MVITTHNHVRQNGLVALLADSKDGPFVIRGECNRERGSGQIKLEGWSPVTTIVQAVFGILIHIWITG